MKVKQPLAGLLLALALAACGGGGDGGDDGGGQTYSVTYTSTSSTGAAVDATYETSSGTAQTRAVNGSFSFSRTARAGDFLYVSGQNNSVLDFAKITSTITVDGKVFKTNTSTGPAAIATASGVCC